MDTNSPNGVLEDYFRSEEFETSSSKPPSTDSANEQNSKTSSRFRAFVQLLRSGSKKSLATLHPLSALKSSIRRSSSMRENRGFSSHLDSDPYNLNSPRRNFSLSELQLATNNFGFGM